MGMMVLYAGTAVSAAAPLSASQVFLLRLYENELPRAVSVGWDTVYVPTTVGPHHMLRRWQALCTPHAIASANHGLPVQFSHRPFDPVR
jgi:hypothetical protein